MRRIAWREPATRFVLEFMGEVNCLTAHRPRGGQFHVGAHRWPLVIRPRTRAGRSVPASVGGGY